LENGVQRTLVRASSSTTSRDSDKRVMGCEAKTEQNRSIKNFKIRRDQSFCPFMLPITRTT
jgi:hypothetical protein